MEVFIAVRHQTNLPRAAFDAFVDGLSRARFQRRVATPRALRHMLDGLAGPIADILLVALLDGEPDATLRSRAIDAAAFVFRARGLLTAREACMEDDQCLIPLADLASFGLRDADLAAWLRGEDASSQREERCTKLLEHAKTQALVPLAAAVHLIDALPGAPARALAAYLGVWAEALLREPIGRHEARSMNDRLKTYRFRAWRFAISRRFDPRVLSALADVGSPDLPNAVLSAAEL